MYQCPLDPRLQCYFRYGGASLEELKKGTRGLDDERLEMQDIQEAQSQRAQLHAQIWKMANEVRGAVDGWDFKQFVLGMLFYRFISEQLVLSVKASDSSIGYAQMADEEISAVERDTIVRRLGYYIAPSQLFENVVGTSEQDPDLSIHLKEIVTAIEASAVGYPSEQHLQGIFADFDTTSNRLGNTVQEKTRRLLDVMEGVAGLDFGPIGEEQVDLFGDAYEYLIRRYAANSARSGSESFTPEAVSRLIVRLAAHGQQEVHSIYDPACGSGSLLLQARHLEREHRFSGDFYGQEINLTTYNLARMNMFLHGVNYSKFDIQHGDTLLRPAHKLPLGFDSYPWASTPSCPILPTR
jgi:type I restriction-modification system, M subunit